jgi:diadenylate cyclase
LASVAECRRLYRIERSFYLVLLWAKQTRALHLALLIVGFHAAALWAGHFDLTITSWVFEGACLAVIGLLVLLFQAELQHSLLRLDSIAHLRFHAPAASIRTYDAIVGAMFEMAHGKIGALIVLTRKDPIGNLVSNGIRIDCGSVEGAHRSDFRKDSPIHDGAVLIEGERIAYAGLVLPLSGREDVPSEFGTRHRAALGLAEGSDALVLVASEERGEVVVIDGRDIHPMADEPALRQALIQTSSRAAGFDMALGSQALVRQYPVSALSRRAGESDLGRFVPGRRDDGQERRRPGGIRQCARGPIHLQPTPRHC